MVDLAFLAPDLVDAILAGEQRADVSVKSLTVDGTVPRQWGEQRRSLALGLH